LLYSISISGFSSGEKGRITVQLRGEGKDHGSAQGRREGSRFSSEEKGRITVQLRGEVKDHSSA